LFFGHAGGNAVAIFFGATLIMAVFRSAGVQVTPMVIWFGVTTLIVVSIVYLESLFRKTTLTVHNAKRWLSARVILGLLLCSLYGAAPFLLPDNARLQDEMFTFIILSAMMTVASTSYSVMPLYYIALNAVTMVPLTFYFAIQPTTMHQIMVMTAVIWQIVVLKNAWAVSKTTISAAYLTEELQDEMTHHLETKSQLEKMARQDSLTELPNRRSLLERLTIMVAEAKRYKNNIVVMFVDIDDFKKINDTYGHAAGDFLLQQIAARLKSLVRESDMVARFGGDEFVFISANSLSEQDGLAVRILAALSEPVILPTGEKITTYGSIGIAQYPENGACPDSLIMTADEAMYQVKATGKSGFSFSQKQSA
jgi:diguanylate cyclase (GGDEF)-like protein